MSTSEKISVESVYIECPFHPTIFIGRSTNGLVVYARYRSGCLSVRIDPRTPAPFSGAWGLTIHESIIGDTDDGIMSYDELREHTKKIVVWPAVLSQRPNNDDGEEIQADH